MELIPDRLPRDAFERIDEHVSEVLERRPASMVVARIIEEKFVRKERDEKTAC